MPFFKAPVEMEKMFGEYLDQVGGCTGKLEQINEYLERGFDPAVIEVIAHSMHASEHQSNDTNRRILLKLYEGSFLPAFRGDLLAVLDALDKVSNRTEKIAFFLWLQEAVIPGELTGDFQALISKASETVAAALQAVSMVFKNLDQGFDMTREIDRLESEADHLEHDLIKKVFDDGNLSLAQKMHLRDLAMLVGNVADLAEVVGDRLDILAVKHKA